MFKLSRRLTGISLVLILVVLLQPMSAQAKFSSSTNDGGHGLSDPVELEAFLDAYLAEEMERLQIPGIAISFVKDGEVFLSKGYGYADVGNQIPFDPNQSVLTTASLGKAFTAAAVLQLADQGLINLDEDIRPYIKDFDLPDNFPGTLTFAHLLTHTDGFEARVIGSLALTEDDLRPLGEMLGDYTPAQIYGPGEHLTYGNFAANLAGYLVEQISGMPFDQYVAENIFNPLEMNDSTFNQQLSPEMRSRLANAYEVEGEELVQLGKKE